MSLRTTLVTSFLATLAHPSTWVLALVGFLLRGGIILVVAPIVVIPSAVGLANAITPTVTTIAFRGIDGEVVVLITGTLLGLTAWLVLGGLAAAATEAEGVRIVAADEDVAGPVPPAESGTPRPRWVAMRILVVRLIAALPLALALANGSVQVVAIAYRELTVPSEVAVPIALRVVRSAPDALGLIVLAWSASEVVGAIAARRIVLSGAGAGAALLGALGQVARHPVRTTVAFVAPTLLLIAVLVPSAAAAAVAWDATRATLAGAGASPVEGALFVGLLAALFVGGLALAGMAAAWRAAVWTVDAAGTFGGVPVGPPGEWQPS